MMPTRRRRRTSPPTGNEPAATKQDLETFLSPSETSPAYANGLGTGGRIIGLMASMFVIGGVVFAASVVPDRRREAYAVLDWARRAAVLIFVGAVVERYLAAGPG